MPTATLTATTTAPSRPTMAKRQSKSRSKSKAAGSKSNGGFDHDLHHRKQLRGLLPDAPWVVRITEWASLPSPVMLIKERRAITSESEEDEGTRLVDRGRLYGPSRVRLIPVLSTILGRVRDEMGLTLELSQYTSKTGLKFRGNLPLDEEAGCKLALIFKLQERVKELDRVELIARRVDRFTQEEASYWLSRMSNFGDDANRWAISGMKVMLGGNARDKATESMLEKLRARA